MSSSSETPIGVLTWDGPLNESTLINFPDGSQEPFYSLISQTNGMALNWVTA